MKKQVRKITKKIIILFLATSLIFTSCFSHKKIEAHAAAATATLGAWTLYEICLYFGGLAVSALGIGYAYENRDEIAEFGKSIIDSMTSLPAEGWMFGSQTADSSYVYGTEALQAVQDAAWSVIQGGGQSPKNDDDNDGDGDKDADDRTEELKKMNFWTTPSGVALISEVLTAAYITWENYKPEDTEITDLNNPLLNQYGSSDSSSYFDSNNIDQFKNENGNYVWEIIYEIRAKNEQSGTGLQSFEIVASEIVPFYVDYNIYESKFRYGFICSNLGFVSSDYLNRSSFDMTYSKDDYYFKLHSTNMPISNDSQACFNYNEGNGSFNNIPITNAPKYYVIADWIAEDDAWKGHLEDIATSLRSLQDLTAIAKALSEGALTTQPSADVYGDMMVNLGTEYSPKTDPISDPVYWPSTNTTPKLDPSVFPNYVPSVNPDPTPDPGTNPDSPGDDSGGDTPEDIEIDLDGLLSLFNILFYLIMIIIMLIYLFLACLAFIVMIFRIPASSAMLPEDMVLGFEHLKTIMIPGMNISIYGFAMALIYMFIIFAVIRALRLEINDFKIPRSFKK